MRNFRLNAAIKKIIQECGVVGQFLWQRGWAEATAGNISVNVRRFLNTAGSKLSNFPKKEMRLPEGCCADEYFIITKTGARFRDIASAPAENLMLLHISSELDGFELLWGSDAQPSSEIITHLKVHNFLKQHRPHQIAVLHAHPRYLIALTNISEYRTKIRINKLLGSIHPELKLFLPAGIGYVNYTPPGTEKLADDTIKELANHSLIIWESHGVVSVGNDISEAFDLIEVADKSAELFFITKGAGYEIERLTEKQLEELQQQQHKKKVQ